MGFGAGYALLFLFRPYQLHFNRLQGFTLHIDTVKEHENRAQEARNGEYREILAERETHRLQDPTDEGTADCSESSHGERPSNTGRADVGGIDLSCHRVLRSLVADDEEACECTDYVERRGAPGEKTKGPDSDPGKNIPKIQAPIFCLTDP